MRLRTSRRTENRLVPRNVMPAPRAALPQRCLNQSGTVFMGTIISRAGSLSRTSKNP